MSANGFASGSLCTLPTSTKDGRYLIERKRETPSHCINKLKLLESKETEFSKNHKTMEVVFQKGKPLKRPTDDWFLDSEIRPFVFRTQRVWLDFHPCPRIDY